MVDVAAGARIAGVGGQPYNWLPNPRALGAVVGTPGTYPTSWGDFSLSGISRQIVGFGTDATTGLPYCDIRFFGTPPTTNYVVVAFNAVSTQWFSVGGGVPLSMSAYVAVVGGSMANVTAVNISVRANAGGNSNTSTIPVTGTLTLFTASYTTVTDARNISGGFGITMVIGQPVDITLRLGPHQLEIGPVPTPIIYPPVGQQGATARGIGADAAVLNQAVIGGQGGVTNYVRNPRGEGAVLGIIGSGGAAPTYWSSVQGAGLTKTVTDYGIDSTTGVPYVEFHITGTTGTGTTYWFLQLDGLYAAGLPVGPGETWTTSFYCWVTGGSTANIANFQVTENWNGGAPSQATALFMPTSTPTRYSVTGTTAVGCTQIGPELTLTLVGVVAVDVTFRVAAPQMERQTARTPLIFPPVGQPGATTRGLLAMPIFDREVGGGGIGGEGFVSLDPGFVAKFGVARIAGLGGRTATVTATRAASALIPGLGGGVNFIRNPRGEGAVVGSPGTLPTWWSTNLSGGLAQQIVGTGIDPATGLPYVDIRVSGTAVSGASFFYSFEAGGTPVFVATGDTFTDSIWMMLVDGTVPGTVAVITGFTPAGGAIGTGGVTLTPAMTVYSASGAAPGTAAQVQLNGVVYVQFTYGVGAVDLTVRFAGPQLERGLIRSPTILPPVGSPGVSTRGLLPAPYVTNYAVIGGQGGVQANGLVTRPANAQIDGEGGKTNWIRNPRGDGAVIGGDLPTYWSAPLLPGMSMNVLGQGVDAASGVPYVDVQFFGTTFADGNLFLYIEPSTFKIAAPGDTFVTTAWLGLTGTLVNIGAVYYIATIQTGSITTLITPTPTFSRYGGSGTVGAGADSIGLCYFQLFIKAGALNITLRLGGFQLERGTIRTPLILPPQDAPDITDRALVATPNTAVSASALIRGRGSVRLDMGVGTLQGLALIGGHGDINDDAQTPGRAYGGVLFPGFGYVTARAVGVYNVRATIAGQGAARASTSISVPIAPPVRLVGLGAVRAAAVALRPAFAKIQGAGGLSAFGSPMRAARATIQGVAALLGPDTQTLKAARARIDGRGAVSARGYSPLASIAGTGRLSATATVLRQVIARIGGLGAVRATGAAVIPASARIGGQGLVEADIDKIHRVNQVMLAGVGQVRARAAVARFAGALIAGAGRLAAIARPVYRGNATIGGSGAIRASGSIQGPPVHVAAAIHGTGAFRVTIASTHEVASARINGAGGARANPRVTTRWAAQARIQGVGAIRASNAPNRVTQHAAALLPGTGGVRASTRIGFAASAAIHGAGGVRSLGRAVRQAHATIAGTGLVRVSDHVLALARVLIAGLGRVQASAFRQVKFTGATLHGAGGVRTGAARIQPAGARINGRGAVTAHPGVLHPAVSRIAGAGRVRVVANAQLHVRVILRGAGDIDDDPDVKGVVRAVARIAGQGGLKPDPFVPRDRVALYGVHLPPTKREVSV